MDDLAIFTGKGQIGMGLDPIALDDRVVVDGTCDAESDLTGNLSLNKWSINLLTSLASILTENIIDKECDAIYDYHLSTTNFLLNLTAYMCGNLKGSPGCWSCPLVLLNALLHFLIASHSCSYKEYRLA